MSDESGYSTNVEYSSSPQCELCGLQVELEDFNSEAWIQYEKEVGNKKILLWICPQCSHDIGYAKLKNIILTLNNVLKEILD